MCYSLLFLMIVTCFVSFTPRAERVEAYEAFPDQRNPAKGVEDDAQLRNPILTLSATLTCAQTHSPVIQAARKRFLAAQERPAQGAAFEDPILSYEGWNVPEDLRVNRADNNILKLSQKFPFPGKLRLRGQIAAQEALITQEEVRLAEITTRAEVTKAYFNLWQVRQNLQIYSHEKDLMAQFAAIAEKKYAVGQVAQPDVLRAQVELARLANRLTTETLTLGEATAALNGLLSRSPEAPLGVPQEEPAIVTPYSFTDLTKQMLRNRPEITAKSAVIERDAAAVALAHRAYLPDFEVGIARFFNLNRQDGLGFMVSTTIPLAYREKYEAGVAEAQARLSAAKADLRASQDQALVEVKSALVRVQTAAELVHLSTTTHIPLAEQALVSSQISYQMGAVDFLALVDSLRAIEQAHLEHITAVASLEKAHAELERTVGQSLPRR